MRRLFAIAVAALVAATLQATPAAAAKTKTDCNRTKYGAQCTVRYSVFPRYDTMKFGIRNNYGSPGYRNSVSTTRGWLDSDNDSDHRRWNKRVGRANKDYWRGWAKYWRACTRASSPKYVCTPWVGQGPRPLGNWWELYRPWGG